MDVNLWTQSFITALSNFWIKIVGFIPNLLAALLVVIVGLYLARWGVTWLNRLTQKLGFDVLCERCGIQTALRVLGVAKAPHEILGHVIYFFLVLFILLTGAETIGLGRLSAILDDVVLYLPKLLGALVILIIGLLASHYVKEAVQNSLANIGVEYASSVGRLLQLLIYITTFSLAIGQLKIETDLLNLVFAIILASVGIAVAIALGMGTRSVAGNIVSGIYAREQLKPGDGVEYEGFKGTLVEVSAVNTIIENEQGQRLSIPNQYLLTRSFRYTCWSENAK